MPSNPTAAQAPVAVVTGGGTGVGAATARLLAKRGYNVAINYSRSVKEAEETVTACRAEGADAIAVAGELPEHRHRARVVAGVHRRVGLAVLLEEIRGELALGKELVEPHRLLAAAHPIERPGEIGGVGRQHFLLQAADRKDLPL